jgi:hypothetical protein
MASRGDGAGSPERGRFGVRRARAIVLALFATTGCSSSTGRAPNDAAAERGRVAAADRLEALQGDPTVCGCSIDPDGTLELSWTCYCQQSFAACATPLSVPADCGSHIRQDYPGCGLTVITTLTNAGDEVPSVYDATGNLVGRLAHSDLSAYLCPSDSTMESDTERAGQFPAASCAAVTCDPCYPGSFPCPPSDAGAPDAGRRGPRDAAASDGRPDAAGGRLDGAADGRAG